MRAMDGKEHRTYVLFTSIFPLVAVAVAVVLLWNDVVGPTDLWIFVVLSTLCGFGVTLGYHRLFTHRAFKTSRPMRILLATLGAMAAQGPPIIWCAHHRRHHRVADKPGDPHSPYANDEHGTTGLLRGLWHAHLGWLFNPELSSDPVRYTPDLTRDKDLRFISNNFVWFVLGGMLLPGVAGFALTGSLAGAATGALWGGPVRLFVGNHTTYAINSIGHVYGSRRFPTADESRNVAILALFSWGEAWHNNHHAFPRSASHGMRWYEVDVSAYAIWLMEKVGLVWDVVRIDREVLDRRSAAPASSGGRQAPHAPPIPLAERRKGVLAGVADVE